MWKLQVDIPMTHPEQYLDNTSALEAKLRTDLPIYESRLATASIQKAVCRVTGPNGVSARLVHSLLNKSKRQEKKS
jgi:hypothetical protein